MSTDVRAAAAAALAAASAVGVHTELTAAAIHRRLHLGIDVMRRLPDMTADAPASLRHAHGTTCGSPPNIMSIMPYGCRAYAVKSPDKLTKTDMTPHAWVGINLGRDPAGATPRYKGVGMPKAKKEEPAVAEPATP